MSTLRLGFHYHIPAQYDEGGRIMLPGYLGRFLDGLAERSTRLVCFMHAPLEHERAIMDYAMQSNNIELVDIGPHASVPRRLLRKGEIARRIRARIDDLDAMLIRGPTPLLPMIAKASGATPVALLIVGDYVARIDDLPQPRWRKEVIRAWARWNKNQQTKVAKNSLVFVNSQALYDEYKTNLPNVLLTRTTTLREDDFFIREDTCIDPPYRVLYTGRMERGKGLLDIAAAVGILIEQGVDVSLDLVGWPEPGDNVLEELENFAKEKGLNGRINYRGFASLGEELFEHYRKADIYVMASRSSEGFPRTIWEAMAHSLPVVATRVGSMPAFLEGAAELVDPQQPESLAAGISHLIMDTELRKIKIARGLELARMNTINNQTQYMIDEIDKWLGERLEHSLA